MKVLVSIMLLAAGLQSCAFLANPAVDEVIEEVAVDAIETLESKNKH